MTPLVLESHQRSVRFHAEIARRASLVPQREDRSYSIPNTPFGIPKIGPPRVVSQVPDYSVMWFYNLVVESQYLLPKILASLPHSGPRAPRIEEIQAACAKSYGVTRNDIISQRRTANVVRPRQVAMYLAKKLTLRSLPEIGRRFGGRDHTTALHAIGKIALLVQHDEILAAKVEEIKGDIAKRLSI